MGQQPYSTSVVDIFLDDIKEFFFPRITLISALWLDLTPQTISGVENQTEGSHVSNIFCRLAQSLPYENWNWKDIENVCSIFHPCHKTRKVSPIHHICHKHHKRCLWSEFLSCGDKFKLNTKIVLFSDVEDLSNFVKINVHFGTIHKYFVRIRLQLKTWRVEKNYKYQVWSYPYWSSICGNWLITFCKHLLLNNFPKLKVSDLCKIFVDATFQTDPEEALIKIDFIIIVLLFVWSHCTV